MGYTYRKDTANGVWQVLEDGKVIAVRSLKRDAVALVQWYKDNECDVPNCPECAL